MRIKIKNLQLLTLFATSIFSIVVSAQTRIICHPEQKNCDAGEEVGKSVVALIYDNKSALLGTECGGTVVHPSWVLTAAHCVQGESIETIDTVLGRLVLSKTNEGKIIKFTEIVTHPTYDEHPENPIGDLALLKLATPTQQPVLRVADAFAEVDTVGTMATVVGWGIQRVKDGNSYADRLQQTVLPIVSNEVCDAAFPGAITEQMVCAGFQKGGTDACDGDSGGPLMVKTGTGWQQVGIVSWGESCAEPDYYGVYTRLTDFQDFISQTVCTAEDIPMTPHLKISANSTEVTASWEEVVDVEGYQFYYTPYVTSPDDIELDKVHSFDLGKTTELSTYLPSDLAFYVAVRAYRGNCYSGYSNVAVAAINATVE